MVTSQARVPTPIADRYANRLLSHLAREMHVEWSPPEGIAEFPELGTCRMKAKAKELVLIVEAPDPDKLARVQQIVGARFEHFAKREGLRAGWVED